ncbi:M20/M25/M40 family metallo-hydrolase [Tunturiibacter gelidoferens]|uniref:Acetylornithine deacetylase/succinyl-diaminopimelate desuccinylase-like protein n=1 Tax=Tunturiibacter gelidiferens TaxID=3069689 RepID=A0ACC5NVT8_9BACT|nr:M20/M25/M40 family metallo-hydrolase [Edaphobacter lichenicola]MBB5338561.1 acetylornithine deacetylase/succinyl-diaminopimelate desuccinylase-like protein [Edaphobacter lichenicola]
MPATASAQRRISRLATLTAVHRAFHWLHLHQPQLRQWQLELVRIPAPPFGESARAAWFLNRFQELGLTNIHLDDAGNALAELQPEPASTSSPNPSSVAPLNNIISTEAADSLTVRRAVDCGHSPQLQRTDSRCGIRRDPPHFAQPALASPDRGQINAAPPCILLSAHLDTVFPADTPIDPTEEKDSPRIHAPGICDNAAGLTALLAIAAALRFANITPPIPILFAANVGEEGEGDLRGMRHLFERGPYRTRIASALILEGGGTAAAIHRALGSLRFRVTITGPGGHSWADAGTPNPILLLSKALTEIAALELPTDPLTTFNVGHISGGTSINSIPESASALLDLRSTDPTQLISTATTVHQIFDGIVTAQSTTNTPLKLHIETIGNRPAATLPDDSPLLHTLRAVDRHLSLRTELRLGSTDANIPLSRGIPALALGSGGIGGGIHTLQEWYDPTARETALRRILLTLLDTTQTTANPTH